MGVETETVYYVACDSLGCGREDGCSHRTKEEAEECAVSFGWHCDDGEWICSRCVANESPTKEPTP